MYCLICLHYWLGSAPGGAFLFSFSCAIPKLTKWCVCCFVPALELTTGADRGELWRSWSVWLAPSCHCCSELLSWLEAVLPAPQAGSTCGSGSRAWLSPIAPPALEACSNTAASDRQLCQQLRRLPGGRSRVFLLEIFKLESGLEKVSSQTVIKNGTEMR